MSDIETELKLFHSNPPRLLPQIEYHRPKIEGYLAQMAAAAARYEERLEAYNALCDKYGVKRFDKVLVVVEKVKQKDEGFPVATEGLSAAVIKAKPEEDTPPATETNSGSVTIKPEAESTEEPKAEEAPKAQKNKKHSPSES